jgi:hypothetical protein
MQKNQQNTLVFFIFCGLLFLVINKLTFFVWEIIYPSDARKHSAPIIRHFMRCCKSLGGLMDRRMLNVCLRPAETKNFSREKIVRV